MDAIEYVKKLQDITYLPSFKDVMEQSRQGLNKLLLGSNWGYELEYEIVTQELVWWLINHLLPYADKERSVILELCAGNGKLAYHMNQSLQKKHGNTFKYYAIDNWDIIRKNGASCVEEIDNVDAIKKYNPDVIVCSWLPFHPYTLLSQEFHNTYNALSSRWYDHLETDEKKVLIEMDRIRDEKESWHDETYEWRQNPHLKEYILIGLVDKTLHHKAFWFTQADWFTKKELPITTINYHDVLTWLVHFQYHSQVFSFKRD